MRIEKVSNGFLVEHEVPQGSQEAFRQTLAPLGRFGQKDNRHVFKTIDELIEFIKLQFPE